MHFENIYQHYRKDTVNPETSSVSLVSLLEQDSRLESKYRLAFFKIEHGDSSEAEEVLTSIPNEFDLTSLEETIHQDYISITWSGSGREMSEKFPTTPSNHAGSG